MPAEQQGGGTLPERDQGRIAAVAILGHQSRTAGMSRRRTRLQPPVFTRHRNPERPSGSPGGTGEPDDLPETTREGSSSGGVAPIGPHLPGRRPPGAG
jgi:hypothetical protein